MKQDITALEKRLKEVLYPEFEKKDCCIILSKNGEIKLFTSNGETVVIAGKQPSPTFKSTEKQRSYLISLLNDIKFPKNKKKEFRSNWPPGTQQEADVWIKQCIKILEEEKNIQKIMKNPNAYKALT